MITYENVKPKEAHIVHAKKIKNVNDNNLHFTLE